MTERMLRDREAGVRLQRAILAAPGYPGSLAKLGDMTGVNPRAMAAWWTKGVPPSLAKIVDLAPALGVEPIELYRAWFGVPASGLDAIAAEIRELTKTISEAGGGAQQQGDASHAAAAARADRPAEPEADPPSVPDVASRRRTRRA